MVSREVSTVPALQGVERVVVAALSRLLPTGFRARQRDEWTADLLDLADAPPAARWRYLFAAAWTLPTLRSFARRGAAAGSGGLRDAAVTPAGLRLTAQIVVAAVGVPIFCLAVTGLLNWAGFMGSWPDSLKWPLWFILAVPPLALWGGGAWLVAWLGLLTTIMTSLQRNVPIRQRRIARRAGLATFVALSGTIILQLNNGGGWLDPVIGSLSGTLGTAATTGPLGVATLILGVRSRTLSRRLRIALVVAGLLALTSLVLHHFPVDEVIWQQITL
ncbi:hypothetical protein [Actinoplanes sp. NPDC049118]|uniref:hypothetical protein n=1 Tax=Actinoplanes sp. NPDC049118 TaxID=3155769 RepID=UPI0034098818